ncbi:MAG: histone H1 [Methylophilaceae bacterium]|nr:MAG: histone H1 [Methylophilaceae bacterium]
MPKRSSRLDLSQLAKRIVDEATGEEPVTLPPPEKNQAAVELGRLGGKKGGKARAESLTPEQRSEIAKKAAKARWKAKQDEDAEQIQMFPPVKKKHIGA